jgi:hypothetical protein
MMFAAQMGDGSGSTDDRNNHAVFDAMYRFVTNNLQYWHGKAPWYWYSACQCNVNAGSGAITFPSGQNYFGTPNDGPAPDGECWMATAIFIAASKWGSTGADGSTINYAAMANNMVQTYLHTEDWYVRDGYNGGSNALTNMFDTNHHAAWNGSSNTGLPCFVPVNYTTSGSNQLPDYQFTDPSYNLPAFTQYWAKYASNDNTTWSWIASQERALLKNATNNGANGNSSTGLSPNYSTFAGVGYQSGGNMGFGPVFTSDASRVAASNITLDWMWWGDPSNSTDFGWQNNWANTFINGFWSRSQQSFYAGGDPKETYGRNWYASNLYTNGSALLNPAGDHNEGIAAQNAVAVELANNSADAWYFVDELEDEFQPANNVTYGSPYWDGSLYLIGLMEATGTFQPTPPTGSGGGSNSEPSIAVTASSISPSATLSTGASVTYSVTFKNSGGALSNGQLGIRLQNSSNSNVDQYTINGVNLAAGASQTITYTSTAPSTAGTYSVDAACWNSNYSTTYLWSSIGNLTVSTGSGNPTAHSGGWEACLNSGSTSSLYSNMYQVITVSPNTNYSVGAYLQGTGTVQLVIFNGSFSAAIATTSFTPASSSSWGSAGTTFNSGSNTQIILDFQNNGTTGKLWIDDVSLATSGGSNLVADAGFELGTGQTAWSLSNPPFTIVNPAN